MSSRFLLKNGGVCSLNRLSITARRFDDAKGQAALVAFLRAVAGVSRIEDVGPDDRFRVNAAMRAALRELDSNPLARLSARAFLKMTGRRS